MEDTAEIEAYGGRNAAGCGTCEGRRRRDVRRTQEAGCGKDDVGGGPRSGLDAMARDVVMQPSEGERER